MWCGGGVCGEWWWSVQCVMVCVLCDAYREREVLLLLQ